MNATASSDAGCVVRRGSAGPSSPLSPCTCAATSSARCSGCAAPTATGMSVRPANCSRRSAFTVVLASVWLPYDVITPSRCSSGLASASSSAIASSCPGSQSKITGIGWFAIEVVYLVLAAQVRIAEDRFLPSSVTKCILTLGARQRGVEIESARGRTSIARLGSGSGFIGKSCQQFAGGGLRVDYAGDKCFCI